MFLSTLSYSSGLAPLKMYRELQRDMGPYRTVHIALYVFTHVSQVNMCFLYVQTRRIQILHVTYVRSCCRINIYIIY